MLMMSPRVAKPITVLKIGRSMFGQSLPTNSTHSAPSTNCPRNQVILIHPALLEAGRVLADRFTRFHKIRHRLDSRHRPGFATNSDMNFHTRPVASPGLLGQTCAVVPTGPAD